eukprot:TRINITY_DN40344_c0_g1_i1.p2 TRINITY_DN40344_c0_g1~~TRINITY_DN40344_c0_g1_i1.p2  ORF type:complete len:192 (+),score=58.41 TRINITY_DN40344_c0_g1_i1:291-866(+)
MLALSITVDTLVAKRSTATKEGEEAVLLADMTKEAGRTYHEEVTAVPKEQRGRFGPPSAKVWEAMLKWFMLAAVEKGEQKLSEAITKHVQEMQDLQPDKRVPFIATVVKQAKVARTFNKEQMKIEVAISNAKEAANAKEVWAEGLKLLCSHYGAQRKTGPPPPSGAQRELVKKLKDLHLLEEMDPTKRHDW